MRFLVRTIQSLFIIALVGAQDSALMADDALSIGEQIRKGKAATALVEVKGPRGSTATAFCVHPSGLFLTNAHAVPPKSSGIRSVRLVVRIGEVDQRILKAIIVSRDDENDLALLRSSGAKDLVALPLGDVANLIETQEVTAFGFPLGKLLAIEKDEFPAISINKGRITSLRKENGQLRILQMDTTLNPGNSGGPILDARGQVVGVAVAIIPGANINFAVPVNTVKAFIHQVQPTLNVPKVTWKNRSAPHKFVVHIPSTPLAKEPPQVTLTLQAEGGKKRQFTMKQRSRGTFEVKAAPVPKSDESTRLNLSAQFVSGWVHGTTKSQKVRVGDKEFTLEAIRSIDTTPQPMIVLHNDQKVLGTVSGLERVEIMLGGQAISMDLSSAMSLQILSPPPIKQVSYAVSVTRAGNEVGHASGIVTGLGPPVEEDKTSETLFPPPLQNKTQYSVFLNKTIHDAKVGGGGRYLVLHHRDAEEITIFDLREAKVVKRIEVVGTVTYAVGVNKLVIVSSSDMAAQVWSLKSFEHVGVHKLPVDPDAFGPASLGTLSNGPLWIGKNAIDLATFKRLAWEPIPGGLSLETRWSQNGNIFSTWTPGSFSSPKVFRVQARQAFRVFTSPLKKYLIPDSDGRFFYSHGAIYNESGKVLRQDRAALQENLEYYYPASGYSDFYLGVKRMPRNGRPRNGPYRGHVYLHGLNSPLLTIKVSKNPPAKKRRNKRSRRNREEPAEELSLDKQFHFFPEYRVIVEIPPPFKSLILRKTDLDTWIERADVRQLIIVSVPPALASTGTVYQYQAAARSKTGNVRWRLVSGPPGMTVSETGRVEWAIPQKPETDRVSVTLEAEDDDKQKKMHNFEVVLVE